MCVDTADEGLHTVCCILYTVRTLWGRGCCILSAVREQVGARERGVAEWLSGSIKYKVRLSG